MTPVFQTKVDKDHGNCMQAAFASLFDLKLEDVPNFIELGDKWFSEMYSFVKTQGYEYETMLHNKVYSTLTTPTHECFNKVHWHRPSIMTPKCLYREQGIHGYFFATVLSPKYFNWHSGSASCHAVIIDRHFNVVHDVSPEYQNILSYPLSKILGYNGVINVYIINPIKS